MEIADRKGCAQVGAVGVIAQQIDALQTAEEAEATAGPGHVLTQAEVGCRGHERAIYKSIGSIGQGNPLDAAVEIRYGTKSRKLWQHARLKIAVLPVIVFISGARPQIGRRTQLRHTNNIGKAQHFGFLGHQDLRSAQPKR